jgi:hypothetical protein
MIMKTTSIASTTERHNSTTKESSSRVKQERFREHYTGKVEKVEEEGKKRPTIFDIVAEENPLGPPPKFSIYSPNDSTSAIGAISKEQIDWIVTQATSNIVHCIKNGVQETSIRLDGASFIGTPLEGMELIVQEFSTAPFIFNISFRGCSSAVAFLQPHLAALSAALHADKKAEYSVNRIEAELGDSSPFFFHRKPAPEDHSHDSRG